MALTATHHARSDVSQGDCKFARPFAPRARLWSTVLLDHAHALPAFTLGELQGEPITQTPETHEVE